MFMRWLNSQTFSYLLLMPEVWQVIWWNVCLPLQQHGGKAVWAHSWCAQHWSSRPSLEVLPTFFPKSISPESARSSLVWTATFLAGWLESHTAGCGVMLLHTSHVSQSLWLGVRIITWAGGKAPSGIRHRVLIMQPPWREGNTIPAFPKWEKRIHLTVNSSNKC